MATPAATVEIGLETATAGTLRFDVSKFDGTDVFANAFTNFFTGVQDDVTDDVQSGIVITRGRQALMGPIGASTCDFSLLHPGDDSYWDPNSPTSPLHALNPGFQMMRPVRVTIASSGQAFRRFLGFIRSAKYDPATRICTVHAEDLLMWLSRQRPEVATMTNTTTGAAIGAILDAVQWTDPAMRNLAVGDPIATFTADGRTDALTLIQNLLAAERGLFYVTGAGVATYEDRNARSRRTVKLMLTDVALEFYSGVQLDTLINQVDVTSASTNTETAKNLPSQQNFGIGEAPAINSAYIPDDVAALALGQYEVAVRSSPRDPYELLVDSEDPNQFATILSLELQDRVIATQSRSGSGGDLHVEQIVDTISEGSLYVQTKLTLSARGVAGFVFDRSMFDGPDIFVY